MAYKIVADVNSASNIVVQGKNTGVSITQSDGTVYNTNSAGAINVPLATEDFTNKIISNFPLSQYGNPYSPALNITVSGLNLVFNSPVPLFIGGLYLQVPAQTLTLTANATYNIYVRTSQGVPSYKFSTTEQPETSVNMFIGKAVTNATTITSNTVALVSRFSNYRASTTQQGSAFPVSTGHPAQTGSIGW